MLAVACTALTPGLRSVRRPNWSWMACHCPAAAPLNCVAGAAADAREKHCRVVEPRVWANSCCVQTWPRYGEDNLRAPNSPVMS